MSRACVSASRSLSNRATPQLGALRWFLPHGLALLMSCSSPDGGAASQTGGTANGGGAAGAGTSAGTGGAGGSGAGGSGAGGSGAGGSGAGGGGGSGVVSDAYATDVEIAVHDEVNTILVVTWTQAIAAESSWLEFTFEDDVVLKSRLSAGAAGAHRDVVLGVPASTSVTVRVVSLQGGVEYRSRDYTGTTLALPSGFPTPELRAYDASLASPERWMLGAVENSQCPEQTTGGRTCYNQETYWTYIMDRKGRIVWYYADPASNATSSYQRISRDGGEYIWIEKRPYGGSGTRAVLKMTLDWAYFDEVPVAELADCIDVTPDGSLLFDIGSGGHQLMEMTAAGVRRSIWNCEEYFGQGFSCYSNTVNYNPTSDTVLMSFPEENTVVEIDRQSGDVVGQYGAAPGSYAFSPTTRGFEFQHFPNFAPNGNLMVSTHNVGTDTYEPEAGQHAFVEFEIDRDSETLIERWFYDDGPEWPMYKGMAIRLANGNTLANYGSGGVIREITADKQTAFDIKFDAPSGDDFYNKMVGHNVLVDDLYALNGGPAQ